MINVADLLQAIVAQLRDIPELVSFIGGDKELIAPHLDVYPAATSMTKKVQSMKEGAIIVAWLGCQTPTEEMGWWRHNIRIFSRAPSEPVVPAAALQAPGGYYRMISLILEGRPSQESCPMRNLRFLPQLESMQNEVVERVVDENSVDYFEIGFSLLEVSQ